MKQAILHMLYNPKETVATSKILDYSAAQAPREIPDFPSLRNGLAT